MRMVPRSLAGRLLAISTLTTVAALVFAAFAIGHILERVVMRGLDQQLEAEATMLVRAIRPDGTLDRARVVDLPGFAKPGQGWGWQVTGPGGRWTEGDAFDGASLPPPGPEAGPPPKTPPLPKPGSTSPEPPPPGMAGGRPADALTADGEPVHMLEQVIPSEAGPIRIMVSGPRQVVLAPLRDAMAPLFGSLAVLGVALALAVWAQLRLGLRPLRTLRIALGEVRTGRRRHVPADQPAELVPLVADLNALIDQNEAQLAQARRHVANLAHGLKTPLAALAVRLEEQKHDPDGGLRAMVADIDGRIRHHLGRARAAAPGGPQRASTPLATAIGDLVTVMRGIHADRPLTAAVDVAPNLSVAADPQDLDEMLGNLLDNAWKHASSAVNVSASRTGAGVEVVLEDDGPGLTDEAVAEALVAGRRLDERGDGHGFGLPIARELAELNGGSLSLARSARTGGLRVVLTLPVQRDRNSEA
ncbi:Signal transduction histidine kinase [Sphingomonas gellani]|uniref:histidine kinase n=1 Tax=Sphingomonas gellani TaxID=1166340 RepID=A0A1H8BI52_9SPHN|nr:HAMP domain-containing sensor histidine kinase [Sphingomonas gellani]SEM82600.1 Signal transduction histidine kinase [Sphingomonas gellani]